MKPTRENIALVRAASRMAERLAHKNLLHRQEAHNTMEQTSIADNTDLTASNAKI